MIEIHGYLSTHFSQKNFLPLNHKFSHILPASLVISLSIYIIGPTFNQIFANIWCISQKTKVNRDDQITTGRINKGNYCFANSAIQALCARDNFTIYLNNYWEVCKTKTDNMKRMRRYLHDSLIILIARLQRIIKTPQSESVLPLLNLLGSNKYAETSISQNDTHEIGISHV